MKIEVSQMREHVEHIIEEHGIVYRPIKDIRQSRCLPWGNGRVPVVQFPVVWSQVTYLIGLHEIGHVLGPNQHHVDDIVRERGAWDWARRNAIIWTPKMAVIAAACMRRSTERWEAEMKVLNAMHERADRAINFGCK